MECKALTYQNFLFLEVAHQKNATEKFILGLYKDHLGNVRLSYKNTSTTGVNLAIVEENNYYPFGLKHKGYNNVITGRDHKYGYGGKEEQDELGLEWHDFHARNYDASLGRWMNIDPHAESYFSLSPYTSFANNPISFMDPDGKDILFWQLKDKKWQQVQFNELSQETQDAVVAFGKTEAGNKFLSKFAKKGDKFGDLEFNEDGGSSKHELSLGEFDKYHAAQARAKARMKKGDDKMTFEMPINLAYRDDMVYEDKVDVVNSTAVTIGHEAFLHFNSYIDEMISAFDNGDLDKAYQVLSNHKKDNRGGKRDHNNYLDKKPEAAEFRRYLSQLKKVLNPVQVRKSIKRHDYNQKLWRTN